MSSKRLAAPVSCLFIAFILFLLVSASLSTSYFLLWLRIRRFVANEVPPYQHEVGTLYGPDKGKLKTAKRHEVLQLAYSEPCNAFQLGKVKKGCLTQPAEGISFQRSPLDVAVYFPYKKKKCCFDFVRVAIYHAPRESNIEMGTLKSHSYAAFERSKVEWRLTGASTETFGFLINA